MNVDELKLPILIIGGSYSNLYATLALKKWANERGFKPEQIICTGDIIAYCAHPIETAELIKEWGIHCIQGNVEQSLAQNSVDCGCGFTDGSVCDSLSRDWYSFVQAQFANNELSSNKVAGQLRQWFADMPEHLTFSVQGKTVQVVHGAPSNVSRFLFSSSPEADFLEEFDNITADVVIAGHSGMPFTKVIGNKIWHNSGALGMPANDGTQRVWFSELSADVASHSALRATSNIINSNQSGSGEALGFNFIHHSIDYPADLSNQAMQANGLTQGYERALLDGLWPSMGVLPDSEKQKRGLKLNF